MNYASVVFMGFASISVVWYFVHGRKNFTGPPVMHDADPTLEGRPTPIEVDGEMGLETETKLPMKEY